MLLNDSIVIDASPDKVWEHIGSPDVWSLFHAKVGKSEQVSPQGGRVGSVYAIEFRMGARTTTSRCEIVDLRPWEMIQVQSQITANGRTASGMLTYELEDLGRQTRVRERVEFALPGVGFLWRAVIWLISRFGSPVGDTTLVRLKRIVEDDDRHPPE